MLTSRFVALLSFVLAGCGGSPMLGECEGLSEQPSPRVDATDGGTPGDSAIVVDTSWLQARLGDPSVQPIDTRRSGHETSRIPGAIHVEPRDLQTTVDGVPSQVAPPLQAEPVLRAAGLRSDAIAVVYGEPPEYDSSRIVWTLRYYGHVDVRYLDGGYAAWMAAQGAVETGPPCVVPTEYAIVGVDERLRVTGDWVLSQIGDPPFDMPPIQLVDARSEGEYASGRIPSARSVDWTSNLQSGFFRPNSELEQLYDGLDPARTTVTYCVTGLRGSFDWLALTSLGYEDVRLYDGSWNEWGNGEFPVEQ
ncbi:MAG: rhodanese-like domain-containing protein [Polyangiales bacterium]